MSVVGPLVMGKGVAAKASEHWDPKWKGDLASAICGGQWPQVRKAAVTQWNISDKRCQLCFSATGTLEHRFHCVATLPRAGWPPMPKKAQDALRLCSADRTRILRTRAMLVLRLPARQHSGEGTFQWLLEPSQHDSLAQDAVWYFDGSLLNGKWKAYRSSTAELLTSTPKIFPNARLVGLRPSTPPEPTSLES